MKNYVYKVLSEDLTQLGAMWARPGFNWEVLAKDLATAKKLAEDDYEDKIKWSKQNNHYSSGDLRYVMYTISKEKVY